LLQGPFRRRVFGDMEMYESSGSDLEGNQYIKDTEAGRDGYKEVISHDSVRMIPEKTCPALIVRSALVWQSSDVLADRAVRVESAASARVHPLFTPAWVFSSHAPDHASQLDRN
jgi:hypothetical protein